MNYRQQYIECLQKGVNAIEKRITMDPRIHIDVESAKNLIELLKEPEPVKPKTRHATFWCGVCDNHLKTIGLNIRDEYCSRCGRKVDWSE